MHVGGGGASSVSTGGNASTGGAGGGGGASTGGGNGGGMLGPAVSGLMMRQNAPPYPTEEMFITSSVLAIDWTDIETSQGVYDFSPSSKFVKAFEQLVAANVSDIKVRIFGGDTAPSWVKRAGSSAGYFNSTWIMNAKNCSSEGGVSVENVQGPKACVPFFWTTAYQTEYDNLMKALSQALDADPMFDIVTTIVDSSCMAVYAEVFYRGQGDGDTNHTLSAAGLTPANDLACQTAAIETHKKYFKGKRRTALAVNNWDLVQSSANGGSWRIASWSMQQSGTPGTWEFLKNVAEPALGAELELQNNGLHTNSQCKSNDTPETSYFCYLASYPNQRGFQTQSYVPCKAGMAGTCSTSGASETLITDLKNGIKMNAQFIELPAGMKPADWSLMQCFNDAVEGMPMMNPCPE